MRHGRAKAARRTLQFFHRTQGIHSPYHILLDGTFVVAVMKYNLPLMERLDRLLQHAAVHLFMTRSSVEELEKLKEHAAVGSDNKVLLEQAHQWATKHCQGNILNDIPSREDCSSSSIHKSVWDKLSTAGQDLLCLVASKSAGEEGKQKFFVASQDETLLDVVRNLGSVPVIRLQRGSVLLLESPSKVASQQDSREERQKWSGKGSVTEQEKKLVDCVKQQERLERRKEIDTIASTGATGGRRKQKAKGPNPLSAKKKRTSSNASGQSQPAKKRRRTKKAAGGE
jgi:U3 small nucleolar RNA-associated protein 23